MLLPPPIANHSDFFNTHACLRQLTSELPGVNFCVGHRRITGVLLSCHGQVQPFLRSDDVIVAVLAQVDLHPVDLPVKDAGMASVV